jgi:hypothetical protein
MTSNSRFAVLADIIPQPRWLPIANVVSIGDLLLSAALAWWALQMLATARPARTSPSAACRARALTG